MHVVPTRFSPPCSKRSSPCVSEPRGPLRNYVVSGRMPGKRTLFLSLLCPFDAVGRRTTWPDHYRCPHMEEDTINFGKGAFLVFLKPPLWQAVFMMIRLRFAR